MQINIDKNSFYFRIKELQNARKIFIELTDNNISKAWEAYQLLIASDQLPLNVTMKYKNQGIHDKDVLCPICLDIKMVIKKPCCNGNHSIKKCPKCGLEV
jgi:hypothetical protein